MIDLDTLERLAHAATPGPYRRYIDIDNNAISVTRWTTGPHGGHVAVTLAKMPVPGKYLTQEQINANGNFIAALSPDVVLALIEMTRAAIAKAQTPPC